MACGFYVALNMYELLCDMCMVKKASVSIYTNQPCLWSYSAFHFINWYLLVFSKIVLCRITNQANRQIKQHYGCSKGCCANSFLRRSSTQRAASMIVQQMPPREFILDAQKLCPSNLILVTCNLQCTCVSWCVHVYLTFLMCTCVSIYVLDVYIYVLNVWSVMFAGGCQILAGFRMQPEKRQMLVGWHTYV